MQSSKASWKLVAWIAKANFSSRFSARSIAAEANPLLIRYPTKFFFCFPSLFLTISWSSFQAFACTANLKSISSYSGNSISKIFFVSLNARNFLSLIFLTKCKGYYKVFKTPVSPLSKAYFQWFLVVYSNRFSRYQNADLIENFSWMEQTTYKSAFVIISTFFPQRAICSFEKTTCLMSAPFSTSACPTTRPPLRSYLRTEFIVVMIIWS